MKPRSKQKTRKTHHKDYGFREAFAALDRNGNSISMNDYSIIFMALVDGCIFAVANDIKKQKHKVAP